jgi:hypothetical protein
MWGSEMTTCDRQQRRASDVVSPAVGGLLLIALTACASHTSTTGVATIPKSP